MPVNDVSVNEELNLSLHSQMVNNSNILTWNNSQIGVTDMKDYTSTTTIDLMKS